jgi:hypothetical protein
MSFCEIRTTMSRGEHPEMQDGESVEPIERRTRLAMESRYDDNISPRPPLRHDAH